ncbi:MAG: peptidase C39 family protein [Spirochaetaceae bacterium]|nr:MAG: peptidase C39 family protein [Spirochaetaceae bacterium]
MWYRTGSCAWGDDADSFTNWTLERCLVDAGRIRFGADGHPVAATSPWVMPAFAPSSTIVSWNCDTPGPTGLEFRIQLRRGDGSDTGWFSMGQWSATPGAPRGSGEAQNDAGISVRTDTLVSAEPFDSMRVRAIAHYAATYRTGPGPTLRRVTLAWSDPRPTTWDGPPTAGGPQHGEGIGRVVIDGVPECSQMIYPNGGNVWCSPVSLAMVIGYWRGERTCAPLVEETRTGVYDPVYGGYGNWAFNVAWAGAVGFVAQIVRFPSLAAARPWIAAGVPLILSVSWDADKGRPLAGAPIASSNGHLTVLVGFDDEGRAIMNEPAARDVASVRRTYAPDELEACWLSASGGVAYVVYPPGHRVPDVHGGYAVSTAS